ncbi:MAG: DUF6265 family protein [Chitinophagaceae bacterium]
MKKIILLASGFVIATAAFSQVTKNDFGKLKWLEGTWTRTNAKEGRSGTERWIKNSETEWQGFGVNMKRSDTALIEKIKIISEGENIFYVADVPENKQPVRFRFTSISENSFTCENPDHDFPKKISYEQNGAKLKAVISGNGKSIEYLFEKKTN